MKKIVLGTLYFNDDLKISLEFKILDFSRQFFIKHGIQAGICNINPLDFESLDFPTCEDGYKELHGMLVFPVKTISKNNFYFGVLEDSENPYPNVKIKDRDLQTDFYSLVDYD